MGRFRVCLGLDCPGTSLWRTLTGTFSFSFANAKDTTYCVTFTPRLLDGGPSCYRHFSSSLSEALFVALPRLWTCLLLEEVRLVFP